MKVLYDSDLLGDDFFTLHALAENRDIELLAVTSFGRITSSLVRARMAQAFLENTGRRGVDIVPGADRPLLQQPSKGCMYCNEQMKSLYGCWNPEIYYTASKLIEGISAAEYIASRLRREKDVVLLCTGPLTNIALACCIAPEITDRVKAVYIMGGVHLACGNKSPVAESNIFNDADAAGIVFERFSNIHVIPLDLTLQFQIDEDAASSINDGFFRAVSLACCRSHLDRGGKSVMPMHDYLAYLSMIDNDVVGFRRCDITVETGGSRTRGMLVLEPNPEGRHLFGVSVDKDKCFEYYKKDFHRL